MKTHILLIFLLVIFLATKVHAQCGVVANAGANQTLPQFGTVTLGGSPTASGGTPPYTYYWSPSSTFNNNFGYTYSNPVVCGLYHPITYTVIVTDHLGCKDTSTVTVMADSSDYPWTTRSGCEISTISVPNSTYQWYYISPDNQEIPLPNDTTPIIYPPYPDSTFSVTSFLCGRVTYFVKISSAGCTYIGNVNIANSVQFGPYSGQQICIVTLDSTNTYNLIVWENTKGQGILNYRIYKQSDTSSQFNLLHEQADSMFSAYLDTTSNPSQVSASYKISIVDSCTNLESCLNSLQTTILLSSNLGINNTVNLSWNAYQGFTYNNFAIWRSANGGPMTLLTTVANSTLAYVDNSPPTQAYYQIQVTNPNGCNPSRSAFDYSTVRSNIVSNSGNPAAIQNLNSPKLNMDLYPNPSNGIVNITIQGQYSGLAQLRVIDVLGRLVKEQSLVIKPGNNNLNLNPLISGTYFIEMLNSSNNLIGKRVIIIQ